MKIAVSGKGGVGKTTISANLSRIFTNKGFTVYAIDADPDSSLGLALGIDEKELEQIKPISEMDDLIQKKMGSGAYYSLNPEVSDIINDYYVNKDGIKFFRMGGVKAGNSSCYCKENNFLKALVGTAIFDIKDVVILDMGAGIEHLTRGTSAGVDLMLIVVEPGKSSVQTARVVEKLCRDLKIKNIKFIGNKVKNKLEEDFMMNNFNENELLGVLHFDESITQKSMGLIEYSKTSDNEEIEILLNKIL